MRIPLGAEWSPSRRVTSRRTGRERIFHLSPLAPPWRACKTPNRISIGDNHRATVSLSNNPWSKAVHRSMRFYSFDPLQDSRWDDLVTSHPGASVFHQTSWLHALAMTYGYRPMVLTSAPPGERLRDGIVFCEVNSWITGSRLVSVPFADHLQPLLDRTTTSADWAEWMHGECSRRPWRYIELRPLSMQMHPSVPLVAGKSFWFHSLSLAPSLDQIFRNFHKSCIQRRIRHAEKEQLSYEKGSSRELQNAFYRLLMITRRRHRLLPQPRAWFRNLLACMGPNAEIRLARKEGVPIAAVLTIRHQRTVVYKYGCSNQSSHHCAGMPFLFWKLIAESKAEGAEQLDLGRTDVENKGLVEFKDRLGAIRSKSTYLRYRGREARSWMPSPQLAGAQDLFSLLPDVLSSGLGRLVYRHFA